jgi:UPF0271 protein
LKPQIDINCDLGESYGAFKIGNDQKVMPHITSANIACGFHGGDPVTVAQTIDLAKKLKVAVGAHPSFPDLMGFGRREMRLTPDELKNYIIYQVSALQGFARAAGTKLQHVKPHGALYNIAAEDEKTSETIVYAVKALDPSLIVFAPPNSALSKAAARARMRVAHEFFADRAYNPDGSLVSRMQPNATIHDTRKVVERTIRMITKGAVLTYNGETASLGEIQTICVHGDNPVAARLVEALRKGLKQAGVEVRSVSSFL